MGYVSLSPPNKGELLIEGDMLTTQDNPPNLYIVRTHEHTQISGQYKLSKVSDSDTRATLKKLYKTYQLVTLVVAFYTNAKPRRHLDALRHDHAPRQILSRLSQTSSLDSRGRFSLEGRAEREISILTEQLHNMCQGNNIPVPTIDLHTLGGDALKERVTTVENPPAAPFPGNLHTLAHANGPPQVQHLTGDTYNLGEASVLPKGDDSTICIIHFLTSNLWKTPRGTCQTNIYSPLTQPFPRH